MTAPKRLQIRRTKGWRKPVGAIYVGRPGKWGNPYRIGDVIADSALDTENHITVKDGQHAIRLFTADTLSDVIGNPLAEALMAEELRGHDLACWCRLCPAHEDGKPLGVECADCAPCHADVLLEVANK